MTTAPPTLLAARKLLQEHLHLQAVSLGITGDPAHRGGYHCGRDRVVTRDYSVIESTRDAKPTDSASALDVGSFAVTVRGKRHTLASFSMWLVAQCKANAPDCADIREIIYSADGKTVKRWDRLGRRTSGDSSHRYHTHVSYHRDSEHRDKTAVFRRYLTYIGLIDAPAAAKPPAPKPVPNPAPPTGGAEVSWTEDVITNPAWRSDAKTNPYVQARFALYDAWNQSHAANVTAQATSKKLDQVLVAVQALVGRDFTNEAEVARLVLDGLDPSKIAQAIPATLAQQVVDLLTARLAE